MSDVAAPHPLSGFPFPFDDDTYMYSTNVESAEVVRKTELGSWGGHVYTVDEHYVTETTERARILAADPSRCQVMPHMRQAAWDVVEHATDELALHYPEHFTKQVTSDRVLWHNRLLGIETSFTIGDEESLGAEPFEWITRQLQEDIELLDHRGDDLFFDAGILTFGADWSLDFDLGMSFLEIHGPVPRVHELGVMQRAHRFLINLQPGPAFRRTNWTMTVDRRLDTTTETYPEWGPGRTNLKYEEIGERLHLRVETQHFVRLPRSHAVMFPIHTYLVPLNQLVAAPVWSQRLQQVLANLPEDIVDYKGLTRYRDMAVDWLAAQNTTAPAPKTES